MEIFNGKGDGVDVLFGEKGCEYCEKYGIEWILCYEEEDGLFGKDLWSGIWVIIELEGSYKCGKGSVDEYFE